MEEMLFLWRRRIHLRGLGSATRALHLGEVHRQPGQDSARYQGRATPRRRLASHQTHHRQH